MFVVGQYSTVPWAMPYKDVCSEGAVCTQYVTNVSGRHGNVVTCLFQVVRDFMRLCPLFAQRTLVWKRHALRIR